MEELIASLEIYDRLIDRHPECTFIAAESYRRILELQLFGRERAASSSYESLATRMQSYKVGLSGWIGVESLLQGRLAFTAKRAVIEAGLTRYVAGIAEPFRDAASMFASREALDNLAYAALPLPLLECLYDEARVLALGGHLDAARELFADVSRQCSDLAYTMGSAISDLASLKLSLAEAEDLRRGGFSERIDDIVKRMTEHGSRFWLADALACRYAMNLTRGDSTVSQCQRVEVADLLSSIGRMDKLTQAELVGIGKRSAIALLRL